MNIKTPRSIAARLVLIGGLAASGAAIVPGVAGAGCTGWVCSPVLAPLERFVLV